MGVVSLLNITRLTSREPEVGWNTAIPHLLLVMHYNIVPAAIRLQAAETLDSILLAAPRNIPTGDDSISRRVQNLILIALASQAEPSARLQTSTDTEIRRIALDTLFKILETHGHSFLAGWEQIFDILRTACPSPLTSVVSPSLGYSADGGLDTIGEELASPNDQQRFNVTSYFEKSAKSPVLVRTSFPSLQLICTDFLSALTVNELRVCIGTLAEFGKQADDINVSLTVNMIFPRISRFVLISIEMTGWRIAMERL